MSKNCAHSNNDENFLLGSWLCLKSQEWVTPSTQKKEFRFYLHCSEVTAQTTWRVLTLLWPITSRHLTRRKKCDDFWLPSAESFPMVYNMNDFAVIIFRRYHTTAEILYRSITLLQVWWRAIQHLSCFSHHITSIVWYVIRNCGPQCYESDWPMVS